MSDKKNYLITGATRGIGAEIVSQLSNKPDIHWIVGVRDLDASSAKALAAKDNVTVVEIDSTRDDTPFEAAKELQAKGITRIDRVYANAGIGVEEFNEAGKVSAAEMRQMFQTNTLAPLLLFQAFKPLLQKAAEQTPDRQPQFIVSSSVVASVTMQAENAFKVTTYATSKAAVNMVIQRVAVEEPWLTAYVLHPGVVATDMVAAVLDKDTIDNRLKKGDIISTEESARKIIALSDKATHQSHSGHFFDVQNDRELPY